MASVHPTSDNYPEPEWSFDQARLLYERLTQEGDMTLARTMGEAEEDDWNVVDAVILKFVCFHCALPLDAPKGRGRFLADGHRWMALSRAEAARLFGVSEDRARGALDRLATKGALWKQVRRYRGHATNWYRPNPKWLAARLCPDGDCAEILEFRRRPVDPPPVDPRPIPSESPTRSVPTFLPSYLPERSGFEGEVGSTRSTVNSAPPIEISAGCEWGCGRRASGWWVLDDGRRGVPRCDQHGDGWSGVVGPGDAVAL